MNITKHLAVVLAFGSMTAFAGAQMAKAHHLTGWISDAKCGASMHTKACVTKCVNAGEKPVFVDSHKKVWTIDNADAVSNYYGEKVRVKATEDASNNSVHIDTIKKAHSAASSNSTM
ncbi:MAG: hypothetical protein ACRD28_13630 [Acidobacteriaceae bacterium]